MAKPQDLCAVVLVFEVTGDQKRLRSGVMFSGQADQMNYLCSGKADTTVYSYCIGIMPKSQGALITRHICEVGATLIESFTIQELLQHLRDAGLI